MTGALGAKTDEDSMADQAINQGAIRATMSPRIVEHPRDWQSHWSARLQVCGETEFMRQVERTYGGESADEEQLNLVLEAVIDGLTLSERDILLDVCCGNGLVTRRLSAICRRVVGVDYSAGLIEIAKRHHSAGNVAYLCGPADRIASEPWEGEAPTKTLMCDSLQHFDESGLRDFLLTMERLTGGNSPILFTGVPDASKMSAFYNTEERRADYERRKQNGTEAIGTWYGRELLIEVLGEFGYEPEFRKQDSRRFTAHYRFDVVARPIDDESPDKARPRRSRRGM